MRETLLKAACTTVAVLLLVGCEKQEDRHVVPLGKATLRLPPTVEPDVVTIMRRNPDHWPKQFFNYWQKESGEFVWWPSKEWSEEFPPSEYRLNFAIVVYPRTGHADARATPRRGHSPHDTRQIVTAPPLFAREEVVEIAFWCNQTPYARVANINCYGDVLSPSLDWTFGIHWPAGRPFSSDVRKDIEGVLAYIASNLTDPAVQ